DNAIVVAPPGRDDELAALTGALREARVGPARLVVVEGEPGIGKTRLLDDFATAVSSSAALSGGGAALSGGGAALSGGVPGGVPVLRCRGDEQAGGLPLQPLLDGLAAH